MSIPLAFGPANATEGERKIAQAASFGNVSKANREGAEKGRRRRLKRNVA
jgi:hypothetical protein